MAYNWNLPERLKIVDLTTGPVTTNGGVTSKFVSLKHAQKAWLKLHFTQAVGHATVIQPQKATAVAPTGNVSITVAVPIWTDVDTGTADAIASRTAATSFTLPTTTKSMYVIFEVDPDALGETFDCIGFTVSNSAQATNFVYGEVIMALRQEGATLPNVSID